MTLLKNFFNWFTSIPLIQIMGLSLIPIAVLCNTTNAQEASTTINASIPQHVSLQISQKVNDLSDIIMSPFCPGRTLSACPSNDARLLKEQLLKWFSEGLSETQIKQRLVNIYGEEVLSLPTLHGFGIFAWLVPLLFVISGGLFIFSFIKKSTITN